MKKYFFCMMLLVAASFALSSAQVAYAADDCPPSATGCTGNPKPPNPDPKPDPKPDPRPDPKPDPKPGDVGDNS